MWLLQEQLQFPEELALLLLLFRESKQFEVRLLNGQEKSCSLSL